jgi:hypothetical protein
VIISDLIKIVAALALVGTVLYYRNKRRKDAEKKKPPGLKKDLIPPKNTNESTIMDTSSQEETEKEETKKEEMEKEETEKEETPLIQNSSSVDIPNESEENNTDKWVVVDFDDEQA